MAEHLAIDEALGLFRAVRSLVYRRVVVELSPLKTSAQTEADELTILWLGTLDSSGLSLTAIILGFRREIRAISREEVDRQVSTIDWRRAQSIYDAGVPRPLVKELETLQQGIAFENAVEGRSITEQWFLADRVVLALLQFVSTTLEQFMKEIEDTFTSQVELLLQDGYDLAATQLIERGLEACTRYVETLTEAKSCVAEWATKQRVASGSTPSFSYDTLRERAHGTYNGLVIALAQASPRLASLPDSGALRDYSGLAHAVLAQACFDALREEDDVLFAIIFPSFFNSCTTAQGHLPPLLIDKDPYLLGLRGYCQVL